MRIDRRPSSIDGIKRHAKLIKQEAGLKHGEALDKAAQLAGFQSYFHARGALSAQSSAPKEPAKTELDRFRERSLADWAEAVDFVALGNRTSATWTDRRAIAYALEPFMGRNANHTLLPTGGGNDFGSVGLSREPGCLEFSLGVELVYLVKPQKLTLERIPEAPGESFLLLELAELRPSGVYELNELTHPTLRRREELLEVEPGAYVERSVWDQGNLGFDHDGSEIPLPDSARLVVRWFNGQMLFVAKGSMWNSDNATYDGRHDRMTPADIRGIIVRSLQRRRASAAAGAA